MASVHWTSGTFYTEPIHWMFGIIRSSSTFSTEPKHRTSGILRSSGTFYTEPKHRTFGILQPSGTFYAEPKHRMSGVCRALDRPMCIERPTLLCCFGPNGHLLWHTINISLLSNGRVDHSLQTSSRTLFTLSLSLTLLLQILDP